MFNSNNNRIIIVDDQQKELDVLAKPFWENGLGCKTVLYDNMITPKFKGVRVAFFDINITNKTIDLSTDDFDYQSNSSLRSAFNDLAVAIDSCIDKDNGPYALIFWSINTQLVPSFKQFVKERRSDLLSPALISAISKTTFLSKTSEELKIEIENLFSNSHIELLLGFEDQAQEAVSSTINDIYKLIPNDKEWEDSSSFELNFDLVFSKIAISLAGFSHAKDNPDKAIYEALSPTISSHLINLHSKDKWKKSLKSLREASIGEQPQYPKSFDVASLNTVFHVDTISKVEHGKRGAVFKYDYIPRIYSCWPLKYFSSLHEEVTDFFNKSVLLCSDNTESAEREKIRGNSFFIAIEISAACDYSQNKPRNHKYILGILTPVISNEKIAYEKIPDSIFYKDLPIIKYNNQNYKLWINLNYTFSDFESNKKISKGLFILKKEIIDLIGNRYANHISRIGITGF